MSIKITEIVPGVFRFKKYKDAVEYMETKGLNEWKIFEGDGFLLYKTHKDLRLALKHIGQTKALGKALKLQIATKISDFLDQGLLVAKKVVKKVKKKRDFSKHIFGNEGTLFNPNQSIKLDYFKVGSFYEVQLYELANTIRKGPIKRNSYRKVNMELLTMRKPAFVEYLIKNKYIKK
jgi:hypothetical protein